jgi:hypothetical protein
MGSENLDLMILPASRFLNQRFSNWLRCATYCASQGRFPDNPLISARADADVGLETCGKLQAFSLHVQTSAHERRQAALAGKLKRTAYPRQVGVIHKGRREVA